MLVYDFLCTSKQFRETLTFLLTRFLEFIPVEEWEAATRRRWCIRYSKVLQKNNHKDEYFWGLFSFSFVVPLITLRITTWELHSFSRQKGGGGGLRNVVAAFGGGGGGEASKR